MQQNPLPVQRCTWQSKPQRRSECFCSGFSSSEVSQLWLRAMMSRYKRHPRAPAYKTCHLSAKSLKVKVKYGHMGFLPSEAPTSHSDSHCGTRGTHLLTINDQRTAAEPKMINAAQNANPDKSVCPAASPQFHDQQSWVLLYGTDPCKSTHPVQPKQSYFHHWLVGEASCKARLPNAPNEIHDSWAMSCY